MDHENSLFCYFSLSYAGRVLSFRELQIILNYELRFDLPYGVLSFREFQITS